MHSEPAPWWKMAGTCTRKFRCCIPAAGLLTALLLTVACSDDKSPLAPVSPSALPVESPDQLAGMWESLAVFADGLSASRYLIPAFSPVVYNARLTSYQTYLHVGTTGERTGLFSATASGVAADTANPAHTTYGIHGVSGSFRLEPEGRLAVVLTREHPSDDQKYQSFEGTAFLAGDTLILSFTLASPPEKKVGFLPDNASLIARLIRH
ncbi:MAG: hypothetical protein JXQ83_10175 [Candidatus Glassbacteria bacterium]|nr:hypothetical protein [Candidatus Glassbacteria bacterium]